MIRRALAAALLGALAASVPSVPRAQEDPFTVRNVEVDVTAESGAAAREKAIAEAQRAAFDRLVARLVPTGGQQSVPKVVGKALDDIVRDFEVDSEKVSAVRYIATFTVRFKANAVRDLLRGSQVTYTETTSKPLLVLPLYRAEGALILWDDPNPWREAWARFGPSDGFVPIMVPNGDIADVQDIGPEQTLRRDADRLKAIASRYGASGVLLAFATLRMDAPSSRPVLDVTATRSGPGVPEQTLVFSFGDEPNVDALLAKAVKTVRSSIEDSWKRETVQRFDRPQSLTVTVPLTSLADWIEVRKRLASVAFVRKSEIRTMSRDQAVLLLSFQGDEEQLAAALAQRDLALVQDGPAWTLTRR
jgi:hypothetical protein